MSEFLLGFGAAVGILVPAAVLFARRRALRLRRDQESSRAGERWAELGAMAPVLVHDLRQPLSTMKLNLQLLAEDLDDLADDGSAARAGRRVETLRGEVERLEGILGDFQRFAGRMNLQRRTVDLNNVVEELADFFTPQAAQHRISVRLAPSERPVWADADPERLKEALLNLLVNAQQAMDPGGGELLLRVDAAEGAARIQVTDTGPGIPAELMPRLFQASFTTKRDGSGLGLPTVRRIVELHGGSVAVHSEPGKGTCFTITLPTAAAR